MKGKVILFPLMVLSVLSILFVSQIVPFAKADLTSGGALSFNGASNYVEFSNSTSLAPNEITIEAWIYPLNWTHTPTAVVIVAKRTVNTNGYMLFWYATTGTINVDFGGNTQRWNTGYSPPLNTWTHVAYTFSSIDKGRFYVNGNLYANTTLGLYSSSTAPLRVGMDSIAPQYWFNGSIDEVRVYGRVCTATEISRHYSLGVGEYGRPETGLNGLWHFDSDANDYSGLGNNGTVNGAVYVTGHVPLPDVAVFSVNPHATQVLRGGNVTIDATAGNVGAGAYENFTVTLYGNNTVLGTGQVTGLLPKSNNTITFTWNTAGFPAGTYTIRAEASTVQGETNTGNNIVVNGTQPVTVLNQPPIASFTRSAATVFTGELVYFNASASHDPDGSILSYDWIFGDGNTATGVVVSHAYAENGVYIVTLTVTDSDGASGTATANETVLNRLPVASFTESTLTTYTGVSVQFNASLSYDPDGSIVSYFWTFGDGQNATGIVADHVYADNGVYTVTLRVTDNDGGIATATATITILDRAPVASFTQSASTVQTGQTVFFNASASYDIDGSVVGFFWTFGDGTNASGVTVSHAYADNGVYTVTLTVTDNDGATASATSSVTVLNRPPIASFTQSSTTVFTGQTIQFNASSSHDPDGTIVSYFWTFGDGANATGLVVSHSFAENGVYTVTLTATDNDGAKATASALTTVLNRPPVATFAASATQVYTGQTIYLNATSSHDPDGFIINYFWVFGDGSNATGDIVQHSYARMGVYSVVLTITDNDGANATASTAITVLNQLPIASYVYAPSYPIAGQVVTFDASASHDLDGSIVSYRWNFGDGNTTTVGAPVLTHTYLAFGNYTVTLTVTDNDGGATTSSQTVRIRDYPTASFSYSPSSPIAGQTVTFNASASSPRGGTITSYVWVFGDGSPQFSTANPIATHVYSTFGNYTVTLTVSDSEGLSATTSGALGIRGYPSAAFTVSPSYPIEKQALTLDASSSAANGGVITSYRWSFGDGNITTVATPTIVHVFASVGNYTVTLTVTDSEGLNGTTSKIVDVRGYPAALFTYKPSVPYVGDVVTFNTSLSSPNGGTIIEYQWNFGDGTPLFNATGFIATHVYSKAGGYNATLKVMDSEGLSATTVQAVIIAKAPIALFAHSPTFPKVGERITFNASASYDPNGFIMSYRWDFADGNVTTTSSRIITHTYIATGTYSVSLTVTDNGGYTDTVVGVVTLGTPKAAFTYTPRYPIVHESIKFNASASFDPNGYVVSYIWNFGDGNVTTGISPIISHAYSVSGNYTATLTVSDNEGLTDTTSLVVPVGKAPVAQFSWLPIPTYVGDMVTFNGSASTPSAGSISYYVWSFGDGSPTQNKTTPTVTHKYVAAGNYQVSLTIKDSVGLSNTITKTVAIAQAPKAIFTHSPVFPQAYDTITFNASASNDPNGYIVSYVWNFGDNNVTTLTTPFITHVYRVAGNYSVVLIVTDNEGYADSAHESLFVSLRPPVADFTFDPSSPIESQVVSLNATRSHDLDGTISSYRWNFGDGNTTTVTTPLITHRYSTFGNYTLSLTVTDNDGLTNIKTVFLIVKGYPRADFTYSPNIPSLSSNVIFNASTSAPRGGLITSYSWNFGDGSPLLNTTNPIVTHVYSAVGQYTVTLTVADTEGLTNTKSTTLRVARGPVISFTYSPASPYLGDTVTFNASASYDPDGTITSYLWDFGDGSPRLNLTSPIATHVYTSASNYVVSLTVTDNQGISATTQHSVNVSKAPVAAFTYSPASPIVGDTVPFNASSSSGPSRPITSYRWDFGDGNVTTVTTRTVTHVYTLEGSYNVSLTVTDSGGYSDNVRHLVKVRNYPVASFVYSPSYPIRGQETTFDASSSQPRGGTIISYLWNFGDGSPLLNATAPVTAHIYATTGQYTVTLKVTDSEGLTSTTTATLKVRDYPTATFTYSPASPIATYTVTFNASLSRAGSGTITGYTWSFGDGSGTTVTTPTIVHVYATAGNYNVTLTVTNTEGLSATTSKNVTVLNAPPIATFNYSPQFPLVNQTVTFDASASYDPDGSIASYRWNFGDGNTTTTAAAIVFHVYRTPSSFSVILTVTDNVGQTGSQTKTVKVGQPPIASFTYSPSAPYVGDSVSFDASQSRDPDGSIVTYSWNFGDGTILNATTSVRAHSYSVSGSYTVILTVVDNSGLSSTTSKLVTVAKAPVAVFMFSPNSPIAGTTATFNASQSSDAKRPIVNYRWVFGDGSQMNSTIPIVTHSYTNEGNYTVTLTVFDNAGYSDTVAHSITIRNYPVASFTVSPTSPVKGQAGTFDASSSSPRGGTITSYLWNFGDGTPPLQTSTRTASHAYATRGNFTVTLTVTDSESLSGSTTKAITVRESPTASFTISSPVQRKVPVTFNATASTPNGGTITTYKWEFGDGNITTGYYPVIKHAYTLLGIVTVRLTVTDSEALSNVATKSINIVPAPPVAAFTYAPQIPLKGQAVTFNGSSSYDPDGWIPRYDWNFGDGATSSSSSPIASHVYAATGSYNVTLSVMDFDNYSNATKKTIEVLAYPSAGFTWSPANPLASMSAAFDASASTPGSGAITSYTWNFGDSNVTSVTLPTVFHTYATYGSYTVTLTVTNSKGLTSSLSKSLTVLQTPLADFFWQPTIPRAGETVTFNASGSSPRGGILTAYLWDFNDGTQPVLLVYRQWVTHTFATFGQFNVKLTVTDSEGLNSSKPKTVLVIARPTANFVWSSNPKAYVATTFDASSSLANGGVIGNYGWDFGDGVTLNVGSPVVVHTYVTSGSFNVSLTVTDSEGLTGTTFKIVSVAAATGPRASFVFSPSSPYVFQTVSFDASASTPGTGSTLTYQWSFGDGNVTSTAIPTIAHVYRTSGSFTVSLTVRNVAGLVDTASKSVSVLPVSGPKADFSWLPFSPLPNKPVAFDGSASVPGWNGSIRPQIVTWRWNFGDGNTTQVSTATITHVFASLGSYNVTLTVIDIKGQSGSVTKTVKVSNLIGDINNDGKVDIKDLAIAALSYGSSPGMPTWNPVVDMNGDLKIDIKDLALIAVHYGEKV